MVVSTDILSDQEWIVRWHLVTELHHAMRKATGIATKQWRAVESSRYSGGAGRECATNIAKSSMVISIIRDLPTGIVLTQSATNASMKHKRSAALLPSSFLSSYSA